MTGVDEVVLDRPETDKVAKASDEGCERCVSVTIR